MEAREITRSIEESVSLPANQGERFAGYAAIGFRFRPDTRGYKLKNSARFKKSLASNCGFHEDHKCPLSPYIAEGVLG